MTRTGLMAVLAATGVLAFAVPAVAGEAPVAEGASRGGLIGTMVAMSRADYLSVQRGEKRADEPPTRTCWWQERRSWPAGNPTDITYAGAVWCTEDWTVDRTVQAFLHAEDGTLEDTAPKAKGDDPEEVISKDTARGMSRPKAHYVRHKSTARIDSDDDSVWTFLPPGCTGVGTEVAKCDRKSGTFLV